MNIEEKEKKNDLEQSSGTQLYNGRQKILETLHYGGREIKHTTLNKQT